MRKILNTLFVMTQGAYLARDSDSLLVRVEKQTRLRVPILSLSGVVCFGRSLISPGALDLCGANGVAVSLLTEQGRFVARMEGRAGGNILLRREQYRATEDPARAAAFASAIVGAKIANSRAVLLRSARDRPEGAPAQALRAAADDLENTLKRLKPEATLADIRGAEGHAAHAYFAAFDHLISTQKEDFPFRGRNRRPPLDNVNAMLSFVYTLLAHEAASALASAGLDPAAGFLHRDRPGRPSLALDLLEEFRACLADRLVLSLINLRQVQGKGFTRAETGAVTMDEVTRKTILTVWQKRRMEQIQHPFLNEVIPVGMLFHAQALLLARRLRGDLDAYPPFFWR